MCLLEQASVLQLTTYMVSSVRQSTVLVKF